MVTKLTSLVSFPGLGIDPFPVTRKAVTVFGIDIMWYGIIICVGMILAFTYFAIRAKQDGIVFDSALDYTLFIVPFGVLGARLYYVIFSEYSYDSLWDVLNLRDGGLAIYGGIIAGLITVFIVSKVKKHSFFQILDYVTPGVMLAQAIGRWGNFTNVEAYGTETTLPWRMGILKLGMSEMKYVHPTFFYESLWNVIGFILINILIAKKKYKFRGQLVFTYFCWYGFGRMFVEGLRTDSLYVGGTNIRISQVVGFVCFAVAGLLLLLFSVKRAENIKAGKLEKDDVVTVKEILVPQARAQAEQNTEEFLYDTSEMERLNLIEESRAERRARAKNPFEVDSEPLKPGYHDLSEVYDNMLIETENDPAASPEKDTDQNS